MKKILLVEDDKFLIRVYRFKLEKEGFQIILRENGVGVEGVADVEKPEVIILDLVMPERDGFETLEGLKANTNTQKIPVIVLTALHSDTDKKRCLDLGAAEYLEKDAVAIKEVVGIIKKYSGE